jgi:hypothetical protein
MVYHRVGFKQCVNGLNDRLGKQSKDVRKKKEMEKTKEKKMVRVFIWWPI